MKSIENYDNLKPLSCMNEQCSFLTRGNIAILLVLDDFVCSGSAALAWRDKKIEMYNYIYYVI
jgi:hypothetical protein